MGSKRVSVNELKKYYSIHKPKRVTFCTENQDWYRVADPCKLSLSFQIMLICENPSLICLKSDMSTMCIDRVKNIEIDDDISSLGTILTVNCGDNVTNITDKIYKLIVS